MAAAAVASHSSADQHVGYLFMAMQIAVSHIARPEDQRVFQQRAAGVARVLELVQEVREALYVVSIDLGPILNAPRRRTMM
jgi:hypothetical protein